MQGVATTAYGLVLLGAATKQMMPYTLYYFSNAIILSTRR